MSDLPVQTISVFFVPKTKAGHDGYAVTLTMPVGADDHITTLVSFRGFSSPAYASALALLTTLRHKNQARTTKLWTNNPKVNEAAIRQFGPDVIASERPAGSLPWERMI